MKHLLLALLFGIFTTSVTFGQVRALPSTIDTNSVNPEDIPNAENLKTLGGTDEEVKLITEFKERKLAEKKAEKIQPDSNTEKVVEVKKMPDEIVKKEENLPINQVQINQEETNELIFGHSFFKNNNIKFYDKANQLKAPDNYVLGVGDNISIAIWGFSDYSQAFTIEEDGAINPRLVGKIYLNGLKFKDAKGLIESKFSRVYNLTNSQIDVALTFARTITVNVVGEVCTPGAFTIPAINTAFNVLVTVGGIRPIGSVRNIYLKRDGKTIKTLDIYEYLMNPDSEQDFFLKNNDYLLVPTSERIVKISGQVKKPSTYELVKNENLDAVIKFAGGFAAGAHRGQIQVKRLTKNEEVIIDINYDSLQISNKDFELKDGDEITIRKIEQEYINYVDLIGPVSMPGQYEIKEGDRVADIIKRAKGVLFDVFESRAYVIRVNDDLSKKYIPFELDKVLKDSSSSANIELQNFDIIKIFSKSYFKDDFIFSVKGAVRKPGDYPYGEGLTLKDALYLAGNLKKEAERSRIEISRAIDFDKASKSFVPIRILIKTINVGTDLRVDKESEAFEIQPYDQIMVRTNPKFEWQKNIQINGEVMYPGIYTILHKDEKLSDIITRAGGLTIYGFPEGATLIRSQLNTGLLSLKLEDVLADSTSKFNYIVREGDVLTIPKVDELIQIKGSVKYPGIDSLHQLSAPYSKGKRAKYYVKNFALGFDKDAKRKDTYIVQAGGIMKKTNHFLFFRIYPKVTKGATVIVTPLTKVPKKEREKREKGEPIDWNKAIENGTLKLTALITLYLLVSRITIK